MDLPIVVSEGYRVVAMLVVKGRVMETFECELEGISDNEGEGNDV